MIDLQSAEYLNVRTAFRVYLENWNVIFSLKIVVYG